MAGEDTANLESSTCDKSIKAINVCLLFETVLQIKTPQTCAVKLTFSELGVTGEPEGGLLPWVSVPESRLSGGFRPVLVLPTAGQPVSLAKAQRQHSKYAATWRCSVSM